VRAIGIPPQVKALHPAGQRLLTPAVAGLLPLDPPDLHKGTAGSVCVIGGSPGLTGAPHLAALGASLADGRHLPRLAAVRERARAVGLTAVPTFILARLGRQEKIVGAIELDAFRDTLARLARSAG